MVRSRSPRFWATKAISARMLCSESVRILICDVSPASFSHETTSPATPASDAPFRLTTEPNA
eukprot:2111330-Heterocapsa_arctica.AAC.1